MKKIILTAALVAVANLAVAEGEGEGNSGNADSTIVLGTVTAPKSVPQVLAYPVDDDRSKRLFVKNAFDFTLSTNVSVIADETANFMVVGTANNQGRNVFIGHSNGGSVTACGDALTAAEAKPAATAKPEDPTPVVQELTKRFLLADDDGCDDA